MAHEIWTNLSINKPNEKKNSLKNESNLSQPNGVGILTKTDHYIGNKENEATTDNGKKEEAVGCCEKIKRSRCRVQHGGGAFWRGLFSAALAS